MSKIPKPTDFNDLHQLEGLEVVKSQINAAVAPDDEVSASFSNGQGNKVYQGEFPEPMLFGEIGTPEIRSELLPSWLGAFCRAVAEFTQTPLGLAVMIGLSVVATCLQKLFVVSPFSEYTEPVNIWTIVALPPGNRKTAALNALCEPLAIWEHQEAGRLAPLIEENNINRSVHQKVVDALMAKASKPDLGVAERIEIIKQVSETRQQIPEEIVAPLLWTDDTTPETLQSLIAQHNERMAVLSDEGGIFEVMGGLYNGGKANINVFLQAHSGSRVRVNRLNRSVMLNKPALTFGLAIQPEVISNLTVGSKIRFRGLGAIGRYLYCIPESTVGNRNVTKRIMIPDCIKAAYHTGIMALLDIPRIIDANGQEQARTLVLDKDALKKWENFSQAIESRLGKGGDLETIQDWGGKLAGAALRIAGLLHVVEHGVENLSINTQTIERALCLCDLLIIHAKAAFNLMGEDQATKDAKELFVWIVKMGESVFTRNEAYKGVRIFRDTERLERALRVLTNRHIISEPVNKRTGGRPSIVYKVNPDILCQP
ncbi:MAG: DUF3987 domain-containing protein [Deltaproteobacteria bacterium]|nr:DUF3987 domain-containing protein [Deltaproteobacteria bacterium]